jgi:hypothetical protein
MSLSGRLVPALRSYCFLASYLPDFTLVENKGKMRVHVPKNNTPYMKLVRFVWRHKKCLILKKNGFGHIHTRER